MGVRYEITNVTEYGGMVKVIADKIYGQKYTKGNNFYSVSVHENFERREVDDIY